MRERLSSRVVPHDPKCHRKLLRWVGGEGLAVQWQHCHDSSLWRGSVVGDLEEAEHITLQRDSCLHQRQLDLMGGAKEVRWWGGMLFLEGEGLDNW